MGPSMALLALALAQPDLGSAPTSSPASRPAASPIASLRELDGAYLEVIETDGGLRKTQRCGVDDQLLLESAGRDFRVRWSGTSAARSYTDPPLAGGIVILRERRRTMEIAREVSGVLRVSFVRSDGKRRSYLYDRVERAQALPQIVVEDEGCTY